MLNIPRHTRDILDMQADARLLNLANRDIAVDWRDLPDAAPILPADWREDAAAVQRATDNWYTDRPTGLGWAQS